MSTTEYFLNAGRASAFEAAHLVIERAIGLGGVYDPLRWHDASPRAGTAERILGDLVYEDDKVGSEPIRALPMRPNKATAFSVYRFLRKSGLDAQAISCSTQGIYEQLRNILVSKYNFKMTTESGVVMANRALLGYVCRHWSESLGEDLLLGTITADSLQDREVRELVEGEARHWQETIKRNRLDAEEDGAKKEVAAVVSMALRQVDGWGAWA